MIGRFRFNGTESDSFNLVCKSIKRTLLPAVKLKRFDPANISGVSDSLDHEYSMRSLTMRITYIGTDYEELRSRARDIAAWLSTAAWSVLLIHDEPDKYYLAKITNEIDLGSIWEAGEAEIEFDCQPFAYSMTEFNQTFEDITAGRQCEFNNPGTRIIDYKSPQGSKSLISITGSWTTVSLQISGVNPSTQLTEMYTIGIPYSYGLGGGTIRVDNIEMEAHLKTGGTFGLNLFQYLTGDVDHFLPIFPGDNVLIINGTGLNVDMTVNFIPLWI